MARISLLYCPFPSKKSAESSASALLAKRLVACANIIESRSLYLWDGRKASAREFLAIFKTTARQAAAARKAILGLHPYEKPCVLVLRADANKEFSNWVADSVHLMANERRPNKNH